MAPRNMPGPAASRRSCSAIRHTSETTRRPRTCWDDLAYLADIGYEILDADTVSGPELYGYGAWGNRPVQYDRGSLVGDTLRAGADAFGRFNHRRLLGAIGYVPPAELDESTIVA